MCLPVHRVLTHDLSKIDAFVVFFRVLDQQVETEKRVFVGISRGLLTATQSPVPGIRDPIQDLGSDMIRNE